MPAKWRRAGWILLLFVLLAVVAHFVLPFGLGDKMASPNCGPEHWRWLGGSFDDKQAVVAYLQAHELELLSGMNLPRLDGFPAGQSVSRYDATVDWQSIAEEIRVEHRPGYIVYILRYHHPTCYGCQLYTFKVTSFGLASLYGCCGI